MPNFLQTLGNISQGLQGLGQVQQDYMQRELMATDPELASQAADAAAKKEAIRASQIERQQRAQQQQQMTRALSDPRVLGTISQNIGLPQEIVQQMLAMEGGADSLGALGKLTQQSAPELVEVYDPTTKQKVFVPKSAAVGMPSQAPEGGLGIKDQAGIEKDFRTEFINLNKPFKEIVQSYNRIKASPATPAGDIALIFNYMKMLDPGSVVREGEFATAQNAAGVPVQIQNAYNKAIRGTRLAPEQRADFISSAEGLYKSQLPEYKSLVEQYKTLAINQGVDPEDVIVDLAIPEKELGIGLKSGERPSQDRQAALRARLKELRGQ